MTPEEYDKFVKLFNEWADNQNEKILQTAEELGIKKPVIKEKILHLPTIKQIYEKLGNMTSIANLYLKRNLTVEETTSKPVEDKRVVDMVNRIKELLGENNAGDIELQNELKEYLKVDNDLSPIQIRAISDATEKGYVMGKEQMATNELRLENRRAVVMDVLKELFKGQDIELPNLTKEEVEALIAKDVLPTYIPYLDTTQKFIKGGQEYLFEIFDKDGYDIDYIKNTIININERNTRRRLEINKTKRELGIK